MENPLNKCVHYDGFLYINFCEPFCSSVSLLRTLFYLLLMHLWMDFLMEWFYFSYFFNRVIACSSTV